MHELSIAESLLELCRRRLLAGQRLVHVRIEVGELAAVEPQLLRSAWTAVVAGTAHAAAVLQIEWRPAEQHCVACGVVAERQPGSWLRLCPHCRQPLAVRGGAELDLIAVAAAAPNDVEPLPEVIA